MPQSDKPITEHDWESLHAHTFYPGGMEGDIVIITTANDEEIVRLWGEWCETEADTNFAIFLQEKGYPAIDGIKGVEGLN